MLVRRLLLVALLLAATVQAYIYLPLMPARMASHFNGSGVSNGWSTPAQFFGLILVIQGFLVVAFLLGWGRINFANTRITIPNKTYWSAPEHRAEASRRYLAAKLEFGILTQALLLYTVQLVVEANMTPSQVLSSNIILALIAYLVATVLWLVKLTRAFRIPQGSDPAT